MKILKEDKAVQALVYINGEFFSSDEAKISVFDHGFLYGDGVFEGIRVYDGLMFRFDEHIDRLYQSAKIIDLEIPLSKDEFKGIILETARRSKIRNGYVRPHVTRGIGKLGLDPRNSEKPSIIVIAVPYLIVAKEDVCKVKISSVRRTPPFCIPPMSKTMNYLNNILARIEAICAGVDDAIMLDWKGNVCEGPGFNVFVAKRDKLATPPLSCVLQGITRMTVMELAERLGIQVDERDITVAELYAADEVLLTSTGYQIQAIVEVDGRKIGEGKPGRITTKIREEYRKRTSILGTRIYA